MLFSMVVLSCRTLVSLISRCCTVGLTSDADAAVDTVDADGMMFADDDEVLQVSIDSLSTSIVVSMSNVLEDADDCVMNPTRQITRAHR